jgi:hypothetical protein
MSANSMLVLCQIDPHTGTDTSNYPALMAIHCVGAGAMGPFSRAIRGYRYLYVIIDKFTKGLKVTPMVKIDKQSAVKLIKYIVCWFRVSNRIITKNRSQFTSGAI